ncbi:MAG: TonB-dependent receptor [Bacteroidaceae bacterium]|nr:TonB-dependent receptor [Bacteroidaceae bacterium]
MKRLFFSLFMVLAVAGAFAQKNGTVTGFVTDASSGDALPTASVALYSLPDTVLVVGVGAGTDGSFTLKAQPAKYLLRVSFVGCITKDTDVKLEKNKVLDLGKIQLVEDATMLDEATVVTEVPPVTSSNDTLMYNTAAFRVPEGSMLEELIKKYPGVTIEEDGTIKINGKTVNRILMKGKDFFGTDKDMALKNISVDAVDQVKFYDKKSDFSRITGIDDGEEEMVLDLQMKKGVVEGFFSNSDAGYGTKERYTFRNTTNYYNDVSQYTLILSANNMNGQGFSDGRGRGFRGGGGGLVAPKQAGFRFAYENSKIEIGGNVRANHRDTDSKSWSSSETFMPQLGSNQFSNRRSTSFGRSSNLNADFRLEWKPDTMTNIIFSPSVSYSSSDNWSKNASATFRENPFDYVKMYEKAMYGDVFEALDSIAINSSNSESMSNSESFSARGNLQVNRRLAKPGRNITFRGNFSYSDSESRNYSVNSVKYYQKSAGSAGYDRKRYATTPSTNWNYDLRLSYTEPLMKNLFLQLNYSFNNSYSNSDRSTYVFDELTDYVMSLNHNYLLPPLPEDYERFRSDSLSRYSIYRTQRHDVQVMLRYVTDKMNINAGVSYIPQHTEMSYQYFGIDTLLKRDVYNISPNIRFRYRWSKQTSLNINYRGSTSQPSMTDLLDITDDSDPLNITKGNPGLKPSFRNSVMVSFNTFNVDAQRGFNVYANFNNTLNSISRKATYDESTGATTTQPDNINGNWSASGGIVFNSAIPANKKFTYSTHTDANFNNSVSYISMMRQNSVKSKSKTLNLSERLNLNYRTDNFDISLSGYVRYSNSKSSVQPEDEMNVFDFSYGPSANYTFPWYNIKLSTNLSMSSRRGYSDPNANTDELLWNAQLSASFLSRNALTFSVQLYDILQQQSNISRVVDALSRRDTETNAIYSYVMFNVSYKFNKTGGEQKSKNGRGEGMRGYGMPGEMPGGMRPGGMRF